MSSILKALRKLETAPAEPPSGQYGIPPFRAGLSTAPRDRRHLFRYASGFILVAAALIFAGGTYFAMRRPSEDSARIAAHRLPDPAPSAASSSSTTSPPAIQKPATEVPRFPAAEPAPEIAPSKPLTVSVREPPPPGAVPAPETIPRRPPSVSIQEPSPPASVPPRRPAPSPLPASSTPRKGGSAEHASSAPESWKRLPPGADKFALQAIAWSENPAERFIVLNEKILRSGAEIEGFTLAGIEEKYILLRKGTEEFRLDFRLR